MRRVSMLPGICKKWASVVGCRGRVDGISICYDPDQTFPEIRTMWNGRASLEFRCPIPRHAARMRVAMPLPPVVGEEGCLSEFFRLFLGDIVPHQVKLLAESKTRAFHPAVTARGAASSCPLDEEELAASRGRSLQKNLALLSSWLPLMAPRFLRLWLDSR